MPLDESIGKNHLHDEVAQRRRTLIQSGEMKPRERLNETVLAKRFDISRTPLREAIKIMSAEGLLDILPNRGAMVASISHRPGPGQLLRDHLRSKQRGDAGHVGRK